MIAAFQKLTQPGVNCQKKSLSIYGQSQLLMKNLSLFLNHKSEYYSMCVNTEHQQLLGSITLSFKNSADMNKYYGIGIIQGDQESGSDLHLRSYGY